MSAPESERAPEREPDLYERLGYGPRAAGMGCVMVRVDTPKPWLDVVPEALWIGPPEDFHVTLMYGLVSPPVREEHVHEVLEGWKVPDVFELWGVKVFGREEDPYDTLVLTAADEFRWRGANSRLSRLPHVRPFPNYSPHVTLGRVLKGAGKLLLPEFDKVKGVARQIPVLDEPLWITGLVWDATEEGAGDDRDAEG